MDSTPDERSVPTIDFVPEDEGVSGEDRRGRRWHILEERSGWRLSFRDPGDTRPTNAGVFGSLAAAQREVEGTGAR
ncbi:MAG: hypothetical protein ACLGH4_04585 [Actinomycetes bacterium]